VIGFLSIFYTVLSVCLFVPVIGGLYVRRVGAPEALAAIATGMAMTAAVHFGTDGRGFGGLSPALVGLLAGTLACALVAVGRRAYDRGPEAP
jgi:Na+/proline symporter